MGYVGNLSLCELLRVSTISTLHHVAGQIKNLLRSIEIWLDFTHTQLVERSNTIKIYMVIKRSTKLNYFRNSLNEMRQVTMSFLSLYFTCTKNLLMSKMALYCIVDLGPNLKWFTPLGEISPRAPLRAMKGTILIKSYYLV